MSSSQSAVFFGVEIPETLLASEMQNHKSPSMKESRQMAGRALAAKAVLLAQGEKMGLTPEQEINEQGLQETKEEALIRAVLSEAVEPDEIDPVAVRNIYDSQPKGFSTAPLLEASHILIAPREDDETSWIAAEEQAIELLALLIKNPKKFVSLARTVSNCPSSSDGGSLGQLRPGDLLANIWDVLLTLKVEEIAPQAVKSKHGWHILKLDHRVDGRRLPFEHVCEHIEATLEVRAWTVAAAKYVDGLLTANAGHAPSLAINTEGELDRNSDGAGKIRFVLGDIFNQPQNAVDLLDDESRAVIVKKAESQNVSPEDILAGSVPAFISRADDDAWTKIISCLRDSDNPLTDSLAVMVKHQFPEDKKPSRVLNIRKHNVHKPPEGKCHDHCC